MLRMVVYPNDKQEQCYNKIEIINEGDDFTSGESVSTVSNLDIYLDKLYEKKVKFTVENDVVDFIQHGVESLVQDLMSFVMKQDMIQTEIGELKERFSSATFLDNSELLRVGSFYEGTKNTFPDEFDFIYVVFTVLCSTTPILRENTGNTISVFDQRLLFVITRMIQNDINEISDYAIKMYENSQYTLEFVGRADWEYQSGPNVKLNLRFKRKDSTQIPVEMDVFVDITPGIKILPANMTKLLSLICPLKPFSKEVCVEGSFLLVSAAYINTKMTFTETEVRLMNEKLSCRHRKVYRLLKYVINANVDEVKLRSLCYLRNASDRKLWLSSYELKMFMIYHHFECKRDESVAESCCLIDILEFILRSDSTSRVDKRHDVEIVYVVAGIQPLVYESSFDIEYCMHIQIFKDKRKYVELVKTLLNDLISDLKSKTNNECRDGSFEVITSFSERLYTHLQQIESRKKRKEKLKDFIRIMVLMLSFISIAGVVFLSQYL